MFLIDAFIWKLLVVPMLKTPSVSVCTAFRMSGRRLPGAEERLSS